MVAELILNPNNRTVPLGWGWLSYKPPKQGRSDSVTQPTKLTLAAAGTIQPSVWGSFVRFGAWGPRCARMMRRRRCWRQVVADRATRSHWVGRLAGSSRQSWWGVPPEQQDFQSRFFFFNFSPPPMFSMVYGTLNERRLNSDETPQLPSLCNRRGHPPPRPSAAAGFALNVSG